MKVVVTAFSTVEFHTKVLRGNGSPGCPDRAAGAGPMTWGKAVWQLSRRGKLRGVTYFWVSDEGDKYHGWENCWALEAGQASADSHEGYERRGVTRYDSEDAARAAALQHARCEARGCFARGRGAGLAQLSDRVRMDLDDPNWLARHDLPAED